MTKRRRLTKIRVSPNTSSLATDDIPNNVCTSTTATTREESNTNSTTEIPLTPHSDDISVHESDMAEQRPVKRRGPTILADIWNQSPEEKWVVKFNTEGQPYGEESTLLSSFIGTIGRNPEMAPQGYSDWRLVPNEYKIRCMNEIKLRFVFPRSGEDHIQKALGRAVKDFRAELKAMYYEPNKHNRTSLVNEKPPRVPRDQWLKLISYWDQDKTKRRATINKNNKKSQTMPHCAGRQSFAQLRATKTVDGVAPSRAQIFIETHKDRKTRDKKKLDEESAQAVELMKEKLQELPNGVEQNDGKIAWKGDIYDQVLGKDESNGRVHGVGAGITANKLWGHSDAHRTLHTLEINGVQSELVQKLQNDIKVLEEKHLKEIEVRDLELKKVTDRQISLESHIHKLVNLFTKRVSANYQEDDSNETDYNNSSG